MVYTYISHLVDKSAPSQVLQMKLKVIYAKQSLSLLYNHANYTCFPYLCKVEYVINTASYKCNVDTPNKDYDYNRRHLWENDKYQNTHTDDLQYRHHKVLENPNIHTCTHLYLENPHIYVV